MVLAFSVIFALFLSEIALRIFWHPPYLDPKYKRDDLSWMSQDVVLNNYGYRDEDVAISKEPSKIRIYSLGDSYTFGWYIDDARLAYPSVLEDRLVSAYGDTIEVINASQPGFSLNDSLERFKNEGILFASDVVTLGVNIFDLTGREFPPTAAPSFLGKTHLYELIIETRRKQEVAQKLEEEIMASIASVGEQLRKTEITINELNLLVSSTGAKLVLIIFPNYNPGNPNEPYKYQEFHEQMKRIAQENNIEIVDLFDAFSKVEDKQELVLNPTDSHPSIIAHELAAESIFEYLREKEVLEKDPLVRQDIKEASGSLGVVLSELHSVLSISPKQENWVYFDKSFELGVQKRILADRRDRRIPFMVDYLKTAQASTHNGWPGAKIEANFPGGTNEINLPDILYGYPIVGVHQVTAFWRKDGSLESRDLELPELEISKSEGAVKIEVLAPQVFDFYRITFDVSVHQLDIDEGEIVSVFKTQVVFKLIEQGETKISALASGKIGSLPTFVADGESVNYVWYGNKLRQTKINKGEKNFELEFATPAARKFELEIPVAVELENGEFEPPTIRYL